jgi:hypothetical protein
VKEIIVKFDSHPYQNGGFFETLHYKSLFDSRFVLLYFSESNKMPNRIEKRCYVGSLIGINSAWLSKLLQRLDLEYSILEILSHDPDLNSQDMQLCSEFFFFAFFF